MEVSDIFANTALLSGFQMAAMYMRWEHEKTRSDQTGEPRRLNMADAMNFFSLVCNAVVFLVPLVTDKAAVLFQGYFGLSVIFTTAFPVVLLCHYVRLSTHHACCGFCRAGGVLSTSTYHSTCVNRFHIETAALSTAYTHCAPRTCFRQTILAAVFPTCS